MAFKFWINLWNGSLLDTLAKIRRELTAVQPQDSEDIIWKHTASGVKAYFADALPSGGEPESESEPIQVVSNDPVPVDEPDAIMAKVTGSDAIGIRVDLYPDGKDSASSGSGVVFLPEVGCNATLPVGTWILAHKSLTKITGGN